MLTEGQVQVCTICDSTHVLCVRYGLGLWAIVVRTGQSSVESFFGPFWSGDDVILFLLQQVEETFLLLFIFYFLLPAFLLH